jgi:hypothetical protein
LSARWISAKSLIVVYYAPLFCRFTATGHYGPRVRIR